MLYILIGDDSVKIKKRIAELAKGSEVVRFGEGAEAFSEVLPRVGASGLFSPKITLHLERPFQDDAGKELVIEHGDELVDADTVSIATEYSVDAATKKKLPKKAELEVYELKTEAEEPPPNVFALADAFAKGDRKKSWVLYRQFIENGMSAEEIHGTLSWQARSMVLASKTKSAAESGLKPFSYTKAKAAVARFTPEAVENLSRELVALYHQSRMGQGSLEDLLEVFLLRK